MNIKHDWFLPIDLINHIKSLGEQISCFVWLERSWLKVLYEFEMWKIMEKYKARVEKRIR